MLKTSICLLIWGLSLVLAATERNGYAPYTAECPALAKGTFLREGNSISDQEADWLKKRKVKTKQALSDFLKSANMTNLDVDKFLEDSEDGVNLGLAFSGGGYRAMLNGAGSLLALDSRTSFEGNFGGILQSANYIGGLSGSSWLVSSLALQNWTTVEEIVFDGTNQILWNLNETQQVVRQEGLWTIVFPVLFKNLNGVLAYLKFWDNDKNGIKFDLEKKEAAGFPTSVTDPWGRASAHQLFPSDDNYYSSATWSDIRNMEAFANQDMPFPFITALGRKPGTVVYNLNSTVVEMNPFEFGSFDPSLNSFTDIMYLGTNVSNGKPLGECVKGFDNAAFAMGTSASLFNMFLNTLVCDECDSLNGIVKWVLKRFLDGLSSTYEDIALYKPNPFYESEFTKSDNISASDTLYLMDGGLAGEVIPLSTLMIKERKMDVVFAFDNSNDNAINWPDGIALVSSYERQFSEQGNSVVCPYVPDTQTFLEKNLTAKPTFFGCDAKNLTALTKDGVIPPLLVYFPNRPYEYYSNVSTYRLSYSDEERKGLIKNGFEVATRLNGTIDPEFKACLGCAMIRREEERRDIEQSEQCKQCFERYCWDGSLAEGEVTVKVNFTADGLTNDDTVFYGSGPSVVSEQSLISFPRRDEESTSFSARLEPNISWTIWLALLSVGIYFQ
ncbi:uncharacterized protein J8A68_003780 [[Candida] subhashii]|uniref:Lysophospholipase n=1 Tax=[Candida] subhashii TaxID=561895 RepID=A0A8J5QCX5_9ASCO|nr:uncharacterized protein J8A68_003780 [[Candida] subhashii]KAG7662721.1 hypothetical protein J8A68_003780 [[Candida] subhashii]